MKHHLQFTWILLLTMMIICVTQATFVQKLYKKLGPGHNIAGIVIAEKKAASPIECSRMCRGDYRCKVYQYKGTKLGTCLLIQKNCSDVDGQIFEDDGNGETYQKVVNSGWSGPDAVLYQSFDSPDGLVLMKGSELVGPVPLVSGQINCSLTLNHTRNQWVDLGIHPEACMTQPHKCGVAGGAISMWVNEVDCNWGGIISSFYPGQTGSMIEYSTYRLSFSIFLPGLSKGAFRAYHTRPTGWAHIVMNYIGPNDGQGIRVYYNGKEVASAPTKDYYRVRSAGDDRIAVGRFSLGLNAHYYTSMQIDELAFFNKALSTTEIAAMYNAV